VNNPRQLAVGTGFTIPSQRALMLLAALLMAQMVLTIIFKVSEARYQPVEASQPLLACDFSKISKVIIEERQADGKHTSKLVLQRDQQGWQLPEYFDFRASADNVNQLLTTLKDLKKGYPISTTSGAAERFKISPSNFERAVELYADNQRVSTLYLGSSPSFRAIYAKTPDTNDIYTVEIAAYQINGKASDWIDRNAIALKPDEISAIDLASFQLKRKDNKWTLVSGGKSEPLHDIVAQDVVDPFAQLSIQSVLGTKPEPSYGMDKAVLSCSITLKDGHMLSYTFSKPKDKNYHVLKISDKPWYLAVDDWAVDRIKGLTAASLLKNEAAKAARSHQVKKETASPPARTDRK